MRSIDSKPARAGRVSGGRALFRAVTAGLLLAASALGAPAQGLIRDAEVERTLDRIAEPVFQGGGVSPSSIKLYIIGDSSLNAFVAGGRNIFINTGMLMRLTRARQIQAVLAHELGHINGGHLARRGLDTEGATGAAAVGILLAIAAGIAGSPDAAGAIFTGSQSVLQRSFLQFSRGEEASADQAGLTYMERAGINPTGMREVLDILRGQEQMMGRNVDPYALTHPMSVDRMLLAERRIDSSPFRDKPDDPDLAYWVERMRAKLEGFTKRPETVLESLPNDDSEFTLVRRAVALHRLPDPKGAMQAMDRLLAKRPGDPFYLELKAQILLESGRVAESVPFYRRAAAAAPKEPLIAAELAHALIALDDGTGNSKGNAEALTILKKATRDDPANGIALRDLALAYARDGQEGLAALATAERYALRTDFADVIRHARHAVAVLPEGSPGWLRAQDLILVAERMEKKRQ
ncbi:M48 family metalloprotease [Paroceanicella profunda]|uniref:M48 family metalloprotease n=1 Tax=Paroceanicella profunda TaxID=2579971 RepID=UPI00147893AB|nr:M48 family metalloprotease [Paroceanicella profunda]